MQFTLVSTIFNEAKRLLQTIADLEAQTIKPSEIIITDAGSSDTSWEILTEWQKNSDVPIVLLKEEGCNVARGRNLAIKAAKYELIVSTDFGCRFHPQWLESLTEQFQNKNNKVVGGAFTVIEEEIQTKPAKANYLLTNGYNLELNDQLIPSSRSIAYQKEVWQQIGGYCEWLTLAADDLVFGMQIRALKIPIQWVNNSYVYWGRHTKRKQYAKEAFRYGLGDGEARVNIKNFVSNIVETVLRYIFFISVITAIVATLTSSGLLVAIAILCCIPGLFGLRSYVRTIRNWMTLKSKKYNFNVFIYSLFMLEEQRIAYTNGYIKGYFFATKQQKQGAAALYQTLKRS